MQIQCTIAGKGRHYLAARGVEIGIISIGVGKRGDSFTLSHGEAVAKTTH